MSVDNITKCCKKSGFITGLSGMVLGAYGAYAFLSSTFGEVSTIQLPGTVPDAGSTSNGAATQVGPDKTWAEVIMNSQKVVFRGGLAFIVVNGMIIAMSSLAYRALAAAISTVQQNLVSIREVVGRETQQIPLDLYKKIDQMTVAMNKYKSESFQKFESLETDIGGAASQISAGQRKLKTTFKRQYDKLGTKIVNFERRIIEEAIGSDSDELLAIDDKISEELVSSDDMIKKMIDGPPSSEERELKPPKPRTSSPIGDILQSVLSSKTAPFLSVPDPEPLILETPEIDSPIVGFGGLIRGTTEVELEKSEKIEEMNEKEEIEETEVQTSLIALTKELLKNEDTLLRLQAVVKVYSKITLFEEFEKNLEPITLKEPEQQQVKDVCIKIYEGLQIAKNLQIAGAINVRLDIQAAPICDKLLNGSLADFERFLKAGARSIRPLIPSFERIENPSQYAFQLKIIEQPKLGEEPDLDPPPRWYVYNDGNSITYSDKYTISYLDDVIGFASLLKFKSSTIPERLVRNFKMYIIPIFTMIKYGGLAGYNPLLMTLMRLVKNTYKDREGRQIAPNTVTRSAGNFIQTFQDYRARDLLVGKITLHKNHLNFSKEGAFGHVNVDMDMLRKQVADLWNHYAKDGKLRPFSELQGIEIPIMELWKYDEKLQKSAQATLDVVRRTIDSFYTYIDFIAIYCDFYSVFFEDREEESKKHLAEFNIAEWEKLNRVKLTDK